MEIYKIPACWPTSFFNGIPLTDFLHKDNYLNQKYITFQKSTTKLDPTLIDFIFQFCQVSNLSSETAQASLIAFDYYINHTTELTKFGLQLSAMTCILVCSKMFDVNPLSLNSLHRISSHIYNNAMVLKCEHFILKVLNYDLFIRDNLVLDRVGLFLENVRSFFEENDFKKFTELCFKMSDLLFEDARIVKTTEFNLLCAGVIQAALVIATKREGKLPVTIKICIISGTKEDDVMKISKKIIKHCLGKQIYKQFNF